MMVNRTLLMVIYDKEGIVDDYIIYLLDSLKNTINNMIILCNGKLEQNQFEKLGKHVNEIIIRENKGFDGGAYKDFFMNYRGLLNDDCDELFLLNDTFYGPLYPWDELILQQEKKQCDFWGLLASDCQEEPHFLPEFIHSFFLVFKKNILRDKCFWKFWDNMIYPKTYEEDCWAFELSLTEYLMKHGYKYSAFVEHEPNSICNEGIYLIRNYNYPIIKYKTFQIVNYDAVSKVLQHIEKKTDYQIRLIEQNLMRRSNSTEDIIYLYCNEFLTFLTNKKKIYIYGHGKVGLQVYQYLLDLGVDVAGFVVSSEPQNDEILFEKLELTDYEGIVIALGENNRDDVIECVNKKYSKEKFCVIKSA